MSKTYSIPMYWECYDRIEVEADNLQEAVEKAVKKFMGIPDDKYIGDSMNLDEVILEEHEYEDVDLDLAYQNALNSLY